jgi:hypothetical protein
MKYFIGFFLAITIVVILAPTALKRIERAECIKWQAQVDEYELAQYYIPDWQREQCSQYGIELLK